MVPLVMTPLSQRVEDGLLLAKGWTVDINSGSILFLTIGITTMNISKMKKEFYMQKWNAEKKRNIKFELTFEQWVDIWLSSGKYEQRGPKGGQYNMCRFNDEGPYSIDNVRIDTMENNIKEAKPLIKKANIARWTRDGEKEKHSARMKEVAQSEIFKEAMIKRNDNENYINSRANNIAAIQKSKTIPVIGTNIETGETIEIYGEKDAILKGFTASGISLTLNGKQKHHRGYTFKKM